MVISLQDVLMVGGPIVTFAVTFAVMQVKIASITKDHLKLARQTEAVLNFARWYLSEKEHKPLLEINQILKVEDDD